MSHEHPGSPPSTGREEREKGRVTLEDIRKKKKKGKILKIYRRAGGGWDEKDSKRMWGGRGFEKQGCCSALHY